MEKIKLGENLIITEELWDNDIIKINPAVDMDTRIKIEIYGNKVIEQPVKTTVEMTDINKNTKINVYVDPERKTILEIDNKYNIEYVPKNLPIMTKSENIRLVSVLQDPPKFCIKDGIGEVEIDHISYCFGPTSM